MSPRRVVVAPDSFKGALSAHGVVAAVRRGLASVWPEACVVERPMADGGEGTLAVIAERVAGVEHSTGVVGPLGHALQAGWWCAAEGRWAVVELARASGLGVAPRLDPRRATTAGTGQLIAAAVQAGAERISVAVGGSATVDGGLGALAALGFGFYDAADRPLPLRPDALHRLARITPPKAPLPPIEVWCDVDAPLTGPKGAAAVFGPQKGADRATVRALEAGLDRLGAVLGDTFDRDPRAVAYAGAAGGIAGGLWAAAGAELCSGVDAVARVVDLDAALVGADLVITGEGRFDAQTAQGKVVAGVLARTQAPVWVVAGAVTEAAEAWLGARGVAIPIADGPRDLADSVAQTASLLERAVRRSARLAR